jgi:hypothetical protein
MDAWTPALCCANVSKPKQVSQTLAKPCPGVRVPLVMAVPQQGGLWRGREVMLPAHIEVGVHLAHRIGGQGEVARLMKLGLAHQQGALVGGVIAESQAHEFPPTQTGGVE